MYPGGPQAPIRSSSAPTGNYASTIGGQSSQQFQPDLDPTDFPSLGGPSTSSSNTGNMGMQSSSHSNNVGSSGAGGLASNAVQPSGGIGGGGQGGVQGVKQGGVIQQGQVQQLQQQQQQQQAMYRNMAMGGVGGAGGVGGQGLGQKFQMATEDFPALGGGKGVSGGGLGSSNLNNGTTGNPPIGGVGQHSQHPIIQGGPQVGYGGLGAGQVGGNNNGGGSGLGIHNVQGIGGGNNGSNNGGVAVGGGGQNNGMGYNGQQQQQQQRQLQQPMRFEVSSGQPNHSNNPNVNSNSKGVGGNSNNHQAPNNNNTSNMTGPSQYGNLGGIQGQNGPRGGGSGNSGYPGQNNSGGNVVQQQGGGGGNNMTGSNGGNNGTTTGGGGAGAGTAISGEYGLLGLLGVIRMSDADRTTLSLGSDLTSLGLNLNSGDSLYNNFANPWSERPTDKEPQYQLPMCYYMQPPALKTGHLSKFQLETLFHIFYALPRDVLQAYSAQELYSRSWRYHTDLKLWFRKVGEGDNGAKSTTKEEFEYFDTATWGCRGWQGRGDVKQGLLQEDRVKVKFGHS